MRLIFFLLATLIFSSCSVNRVLTSDLSDKQVYQLYKQSLKQKNDLELLHNVDSTYALMLQPSEPDKGDLCSFIVIDIVNRSLNYESINKYRDVKWLDIHTLKLKKNVGIIKVNTDPKQKKPNSFFEYYDVETKEITEVKQTKQERP